MVALMEGASPIITLPSRLDTKAADGLKQLLLEGLAEHQGGEALRLDASHVEYVGGLCVRLLLASGLKVSAWSDKAEEAFTLFGVRGQLLAHEGAEEAHYGG
ncbi:MULTISPECIES: STAS domain-containing protein [Bombella]|uniref:STAS domain-containing protein n=1 Tax=Bombella pollinis TaxID=2967337 RepID=A0ABT3WM17_9PROT|nr:MULTISPECIES: STAS domain-containing protein [Bombella]MCX5619943.1 STAS domain-containing protein [Bombella pollinis]MUG05134.1 hypothetical protein [Bombella sp. ESL0378]MUG90681.1 hypothetical protein [Bombella sp. ESL0385]